MLFIVSGRDQPNGIEQRLKFRSHHRAHYEGLGDDLLLSGPYMDPNGEPIGSMIIMRAPSLEAADEFVQADPYVTNKVFASISVSRWDWFMKRPEDLVS